MMHQSTRLTAVLFFALLVFASYLAGATKIDEQDIRTPTKETLAAVNKITEAIDGKRMDEAADLARSLFKASKPATIDAALAQLLLAQIESTQEHYAEAIPHLEAALAINLFDPESTERYVVGLANLYVEAKQPAKAVALLKTFVEKTPSPAAETLYMYSALLMQEGEGDEAFVQAERLMRHDLKPKKEYYQLAAACAQNVKNYDKACAYLERMIEMDPQNEMLWNQLVAMHYSAGELVAAIVSLERAQSLGLLKAPLNYATEVELYYNLERFPEAAALLEQGLANKTLPQEQRLWEMLCMCYDQMGEPEKAMDVLKRASAQTEWSAIDTRMAERNYRAGKFDQVIINLNTALKKGGIDRLGDFWIMMASAALELRDIKKAEHAMDEASKYPDAASKVERLRRTYAQIKAVIQAQTPAEAGQEGN